MKVEGWGDWRRGAALSNGRNGAIGARLRGLKCRAYDAGERDWLVEPGNSARLGRRPLHGWREGRGGKKDARGIQEEAGEERKKSQEEAQEPTRKNGVWGTRGRKKGGRPALRDGRCILLFGGGGVFELFGEEIPVGGGFEALPEVDEVGVGADEDARFVLIDAAENFCGGDVGGGASNFFEAGEAFGAEGCGGLRAFFGGSGDAGADEAGMDAGDTDAGGVEFVAERFGETAHGKFAGAVGALTDGSEKAEQAGSVDEMRAFFFFEQGQEMEGAVDDAPEINVHKPAKILE